MLPADVGATAGGVVDSSRGDPVDLPVSITSEHE
jgi:hypothetical protein